MPAASGLLTRVLTVPGLALGTMIVAAGGAPWVDATLGRTSPGHLLQGSAVWLAVGMVFLLVVGAMGGWDPSGLLACAVVAVPGLVAVVVPALTVAAADLVAGLSGTLSMGVSYGLGVGTPALLAVPTVALGVALVHARRPREVGVRAQAAAVVGGAVLWVGGTVLQLVGISTGLAAAGDTTPPVVAVLPGSVVLIGSGLVVLAVLATRWTPLGLLVPAMTATTATILCLTPVPSLLVDALGDAHLGPVHLASLVATATAAVLTGLGPGILALFVGGTVALWSTHARVRRLDLDRRLADLGEEDTVDPGVDPRFSSDPGAGYRRGFDPEADPDRVTGRED